jgi:BMFP domain-containing protein YqiC
MFSKEFHEVHEREIVNIVKQYLEDTDFDDYVTKPDFSHERDCLTRNVQDEIEKKMASATNELESYAEDLKTNFERELEGTVESATSDYLDGIDFDEYVAERVDWDDLVKDCNVDFEQVIRENVNFDLVAGPFVERAAEKAVERLSDIRIADMGQEIRTAFKYDIEAVQNSLDVAREHITFLEGQISELREQISQIRNQPKKSWFARLIGA